HRQCVKLGSREMGVRIDPEGPHAGSGRCRGTAAPSRVALGGYADPRNHCRGACSGNPGQKLPSGYETVLIVNRHVEPPPLTWPDDMTKRKWPQKGTKITKGLLLSFFASLWPLLFPVQP